MTGKHEWRWEGIVHSPTLEKKDRDTKNNGSFTVNGREFILDIIVLVQWNIRKNGHMQETEKETERKNYSE